MREDQDMPRADGLRPDDPPFREYFSTQPDKPTEAVQRQVSRFERRTKDYIGHEALDVPKPPITQAQLQPKDDTVTDMHDAADVIGVIRRIAKGENYVRVDKLIEALS